MGLHPISEDKYTEFALRQFSQNGKTVDSDVVTEVYEKFSGVTSCLQRVMNVLFYRTPAGGHCTLDMVDEAIDYLLDLYTDNYSTLFSQMSEKQRIVFRAIASEGEATAVTSAAFIKKYRLTSASSVSSALRGLVDKDFVTIENNKYIIYDHFFALWVRKRE